MSKLGVLAGGGQLPARVIAACRRQGRPYFVIAFRGFTEPATVDSTPHAWVPLEKVGSVLRHLREFSEACATMTSGIGQTFRDRWKRA